MPQVKNESKPSDLIGCPICGKMVRRRGLLSHVRLTHQEVDAKSVVKKIMIPKVKGKILLQVVESASDEIQMNWINLTQDEIKLITKLFKTHFKSYF